MTAVTYNKQGSTTSDPVAIQVVKPSVLTAQSSLTVTKGHSASFAVKLSTAPSSPVTVHLSDAGTGTTVSKGQALTFTPSNWNQPQAVTVAAAQTKAARQPLDHHRVSGRAGERLGGSHRRAGRDRI